MADPVAIAKTAIAVAKTLADEEKRNKLIFAIVIFVVLFLCLILVPLYLLTHPIETIKMIITDDTEISAVQNIQKNYGTSIGYGELTYKGKFPFPLEQADKVVVTSEYGYRVHPTTGEYKLHTGIDLSGVHHDNILSIANGEVIWAGIQGGYGNCIEIKHELEGEIFYSFYGHLSQIKVQTGQEVIQGQIIALEGGDPKLDPNSR